MKKIKMVKTAGEFVVSIGVIKIVTNIIKLTTPTNIGVISKICIGVGGFVLANMIDDQVKDYIDRLILTIDKSKSQFKEMISTEKTESE